MTDVVRDIIERIRQLSPEDRNEVGRELDRLFEEDWDAATEELRREAERLGITEDDIDRACHRVRYGT